MLNMLVFLVLPIVLFALGGVTLAVALVVDSRPPKDPARATWLGFVAVSQVGVLLAVAVMSVPLSSISNVFNLADYGTPSQAASAQQFAVLAGLLGPLLAGALAALLHVWLRKRSLKWGLVFMMSISLPSYAAVAALAGLLSLFTS